MTRKSLYPVVRSFFAANGNLWAGAGDIFGGSRFLVKYTALKKASTLNKTCYRCLTDLVVAGVLVSGSLEKESGRKYYRLATEADLSSQQKCCGELLLDFRDGAQPKSDSDLQSSQNSDSTRYELYVNETEQDSSNCSQEYAGSIERTEPYLKQRHGEVIDSTEGNLTDKFTQESIYVLN